MGKGFVYILRNEAMPGLLKIGYSVKVPTERVDELFTTGVPEPFELAYYCLVENADKLEHEIHRDLSANRHRGNREFFRIELDVAIQSINKMCRPEHEWFETRPRSVTSSVAGDMHAPFYGVNITSRDDHDGEMKEMVKFVEAAHQRSLTPYVRSLFYDSNSCCCYFELSDKLDQYDPVAIELLEIARDSIGQFEWFGQVQHGRMHDELDEF